MVPLGSELGRFLGVGVIASVVTVGTFNALVHWGEAPMSAAPVTAFILSFVAGILVAYLGNQLWAFRHRASRRPVRDFTTFVALNALALVIPSLMLGLSRHVLGLHSFWADNIAANGIGLVLATAFRFWAYRRWIFVT